MLNNDASLRKDTNEGDQSSQRLTSSPKVFVHSESPVIETTGRPSSSPPRAVSPMPVSRGSADALEGDVDYDSAMSLLRQHQRERSASIPTAVLHLRTMTIPPQSSDPNVSALSDDGSSDGCRHPQQPLASGAELGRRKVTIGGGVVEEVPPLLEPPTSLKPKHSTSSDQIAHDITKPVSSSNSFQMALGSSPQSDRSFHEHTTDEVESVRGGDGVSSELPLNRHEHTVSESAASTQGAPSPPILQQTQVGLSILKLPVKPPMSAAENISQPHSQNEQLQQQQHPPLPNSTQTNTLHQSEGASNSTNASFASSFGGASGRGDPSTGTNAIASLVTPAPVVNFVLTPRQVIGKDGKATTNNASLPGLPPLTPRLATPRGGSTNTNVALPGAATKDGKGQEAMLTPRISTPLGLSQNYPQPHNPSLGNTFNTVGSSSGNNLSIAHSEDIRQQQSSGHVGVEGSGGNGALQMRVFSNVPQVLSRPSSGSGMPTVPSPTTETIVIGASMSPPPLTMATRLSGSGLADQPSPSAQPQTKLSSAAGTPNREKTTSHSNSNSNIVAPGTPLVGATLGQTSTSSGNRSGSPNAIQGAAMLTQQAQQSSPNPVPLKRQGSLLAPAANQNAPTTATISFGNTAMSSPPPNANTSPSLQPRPVSPTSGVIHFHMPAAQSLGAVQSTSHQSAAISGRLQQPSSSQSLLHRSHTAPQLEPHLHYSNPHHHSTASVLSNMVPHNASHMQNQQQNSPTGAGVGLDRLDVDLHSSNATTAATGTVHGAQSEAGYSVGHSHHYHNLSAALSSTSPRSVVSKQQYPMAQGTPTSSSVATFGIGAGLPVHQSLVKAGQTPAAPTMHIASGSFTNLGATSASFGAASNSLANPPLLYPQQAASMTQQQLNPNEITEPIPTTTVLADDGVTVLTIPVTEPRFRRQRLIGRGATKNVFKAFDEEEGVEVAWNEINYCAMPDPSQVVNEIELLRELDHPNVIHCIAAWEDHERECVVFITELMASGTLSDFIANQTSQQSLKRIALVKYARQILLGLSYLHSNDIIHRDLKCANIFINGNKGEVKIGDLGLSIAGRNATSVLGTPEFMAPEMCEENYDNQIDIWSMGMVIYEMATGKKPYYECDNVSQIYKKVHSKVLPVFPPTLDEEIVAIIRQCLNFNPEDRPTADALLAMPFFEVKPSRFSRRDRPLGDSTYNMTINDSLAGTSSQVLNSTVLSSVGFGGVGPQRFPNTSPTFHYSPNAASPTTPRSEGLMGHLASAVDVRGAGANSSTVSGIGGLSGVGNQPPLGAVLTRKESYNRYSLATSPVHSQFGNSMASRGQLLNRTHTSQLTSPHTNVGSMPRNGQGATAPSAVVISGSGANLLRRAPNMSSQASFSVTESSPPPQPPTSTAPPQAISNTVAGGTEVLVKKGKYNPNAAPSNSMTTIAAASAAAAAAAKESFVASKAGTPNPTNPTAGGINTPNNNTSVVANYSFTGSTASGGLQPQLRLQASATNLPQLTVPKDASKDKDFSSAATSFNAHTAGSNNTNTANVVNHSRTAGTTLDRSIGVSSKHSAVAHAQQQQQQQPPPTYRQSQQHQHPAQQQLLQQQHQQSHMADSRHQSTTPLNSVFAGDEATNRTSFNLLDDEMCEVLRPATGIESDAIGTFTENNVTANNTEHEAHSEFTYSLYREQRLASGGGGGRGSGRVTANSKGALRPQPRRPLFGRHRASGEGEGITSKNGAEGSTSSAKHDGIQRAHYRHSNSYEELLAKTYGSGGGMGRGSSLHSGSLNRGGGGGGHHSQARRLQLFGQPRGHEHYQSAPAYLMGADAMEFELDPKAMRKYVPRRAQDLIDGDGDDADLDMEEGEEEEDEEYEEDLLEELEEDEENDEYSEEDHTRRTNYSVITGLEEWSTNNPPHLQGHHRPSRGANDRPNRRMSEVANKSLLPERPRRATMTPRQDYPSEDRSYDEGLSAREHSEARVMHPDLANRFHHRSAVVKGSRRKPVQASPQSLVSPVGYQISKEHSDELREWLRHAPEAARPFVMQFAASQGWLEHSPPQRRQSETVMYENNPDALPTPTRHNQTLMANNTTLAGTESAATGGVRGQREVTVRMPGIGVQELQQGSPMSGDSFHPLSLGYGNSTPQTTMHGHHNPNNLSGNYNTTLNSAMLAGIHSNNPSLSQSPSQGYIFHVPVPSSDAAGSASGNVTKPQQGMGAPGSSQPMPITSSPNQQGSDDRVSSPDAVPPTTAVTMDCMGVGSSDGSPGALSGLRATPTSLDRQQALLGTTPPPRLAGQRSFLDSKRHPSHSTGVGVAVAPESTDTHTAPHPNSATATTAGPSPSIGFPTASADHTHQTMTAEASLHSIAAQGTGRSVSLTTNATATSPSHTFAAQSTAAVPPPMAQLSSKPSLYEEVLSLSSSASNLMNAAQQQQQQQQQQDDARRDVIAAANAALMLQQKQAGQQPPQADTNVDDGLGFTVRSIADSGTVTPNTVGNRSFGAALAPTQQQPQHQPAPLFTPNTQLFQQQLDALDAQQHQLRSQSSMGTSMNSSFGVPLVQPMVAQQAQPQAQNKQPTGMSVKAAISQRRNNAKAQLLQRLQLQQQQFQLQQQQQERQMLATGGSGGAFGSPTDPIEDSRGQVDNQQQTHQDPNASVNALENTQNSARPSDSHRAALAKVAEQQLVAAALGMGGGGGGGSGGVSGSGRTSLRNRQQVVQNEFDTLQQYPSRMAQVNSQQQQPQRRPAHYSDFGYAEQGNHVGYPERGPATDNRQFRPTLSQLTELNKNARGMYHHLGNSVGEWLSSVSTPPPAGANRANPNLQLPQRAFVHQPQRPASTAYIPSAYQQMIPNVASPMAQQDGSFASPLVIQHPTNTAVNAGGGDGGGLTPPPSFATGSVTPPLPNFAPSAATSQNQPPAPQQQPQQLPLSGSFRSDDVANRNSYNSQTPQPPQEPPSSQGQPPLLLQHSFGHTAQTADQSPPPSARPTPQPPTDSAEKAERMRRSSALLDELFSAASPVGNSSGAFPPTTTSSTLVDPSSLPTGNHHHNGGSLPATFGTDQATSTTANNGGYTFNTTDPFGLRGGGNVTAAAGPVAKTPSRQGSHRDLVAAVESMRRQPSFVAAASSCIGGSPLAHNGTANPTSVFYSSKNASYDNTTSCLHATHSTMPPISGSGGVSPTSRPNPTTTSGELGSQLLPTQHQSLSTPAAPTAVTVAASADPLDLLFESNTVPSAIIGVNFGNQRSLSGIGQQVPAWGPQVSEGLSGNTLSSGNSLTALQTVPSLKQPLSGPNAVSSSNDMLAGVPGIIFAHSTTPTPRVSVGRERDGGTTASLNGSMTIATAASPWEAANGFDGATVKPGKNSPLMRGNSSFHPATVPTSEVISLSPVRKEPARQPVPQPLEQAALSPSPLPRCTSGEELSFVAPSPAAVNTSNVTAEYVPSNSFMKNNAALPLPTVATPTPLPTSQFNSQQHQQQPQPTFGAQPHGISTSSTEFHSHGGPGLANVLLPSPLFSNQSPQSHQQVSPLQAGSDSHLPTSVNNATFGHGSAVSASPVLPAVYNNNSSATHSEFMAMAPHLSTTAPPNASPIAALSALSILGVGSMLMRQDSAVPTNLVSPLTMNGSLLNNTIQSNGALGSGSGNVAGGSGSGGAVGIANPNQSSIVSAPSPLEREKSFTQQKSAAALASEHKLLVAAMASPTSALPSPALGASSEPSINTASFSGLLMPTNSSSGLNGSSMPTPGSVGAGFQL